MTKRILVTGGSGFIGTNMVAFYLDQNDTEVLNLDYFPPRNPEHLHVWKQVNLLDADDLVKKVTDFNPNYVFHLGARTDLDERKNLSGYDANITGVSNMIHALNQCRDLKRVIFASSMLVCRVGFDPVNYEEYCPPNLYGESKVQTEKLIKQSGIKNFEWCIIRPTSLWGPWFDKPYKDFFTHVLNQTFFKLSGKKVSTKTFGFIGNAVYQIDQLMFARRDQMQSRVFYIGDIPPTQINEWAEEIAQESGIRLRTLPYVIFKLAALAGDCFVMLGIRFPMTSFRLKNMTVDNKVSLLKDTFTLIPKVPYTRQEGNRITLEWLKKHEGR